MSTDFQKELAEAERGEAEYERLLRAYGRLVRLHSQVLGLTFSAGMLTVAAGLRPERSSAETATELGRDLRQAGEALLGLATELEASRQAVGKLRKRTERDKNGHETFDGQS